MLTSAEAKELRSLQRRKTREQTGRFLAEGVRVVEDLLASSTAVRWVLASSSLEESERGRALLAEVGRRGLPLRSVSGAEFSRHAGTEHPQGVLAVAEIPRVQMAGLRLDAAPLVLLVLDAVQDPGNFGTLVRSAEALGAVGVVALPGTVDPWNSKSVRAAAGSSFRLPIVAAEWPVLREWLAVHGVLSLAAEVGGEPVGEVRAQRVALVVGNEGAGVAGRVRREADRRVGIPLRGRAESLNVAAAAAILMYELLR